MANGILSFDTHLHAMESPGNSTFGKRSATEAVRDPNGLDATEDSGIPSPRSFDKRRKLDDLNLATTGDLGGPERTS